MRRYKSFVVVLFALSLAAPVAHAQIVGAGAGPDPVTYTLSPETPGPNELEYIEISGVGNLVGNATITWQKDGQVVASGPGKSTFSFVTGGVGTATQIHITIQSDTNGTISKDFVFAPSIVDLVWEADTSVPPFFMGKALYSAGSRLKVVALPTIISGRSVVGADKLSFQWKLNGSNIPQASGLGRNVYVFDGDQLHREEDVAVDVLLGGKKVGHGEITIPATNPQVILYSHDALRGELLDGALQNTLSLGQSEITLQAQPYYVANSSLAQGNLQYAWTLGDQDATGPDSARGLLTLRQTGQGPGAAAVGVTIQNTDSSKLIQSAQSFLQILFGQSSSSLFSSLFGL